MDNNFNHEIQFARSESGASKVNSTGSIFPNMRRRYKIALSLAVVAFLLLPLLLPTKAERKFSLGFTAARKHFPEQSPRVYSDYLIVVWVTNTGPLSMTLEMPCTQFEDAKGQLIKDFGCSWNSQEYGHQLPPGSVAWYPICCDPERKKLRFVFEYRRKGGALRTAISKVLRVLPLKQLSKRMYESFQKNGLIDGVLLEYYEGPWIENTNGRAKEKATGSTNRADRVEVNPR